MIGKICIRWTAGFALFIICITSAGGETYPPVKDAWKNKGDIEQTPPAVEYLGLTLEEAFARFGVPEEVFPFRGEEEWQDNVVFYYPGHLYLFWFQDRVWQVRIDERSGDSFLGIRMGMSRGEVIDILGDPYYGDNDSIVYNLPDRGVPVRMRLFFSAEIPAGGLRSDKILIDAYFYRGDF